MKLYSLVLQLEKVGYNINIFFQKGKIRANRKKHLTYRVEIVVKTSN